MNNSSEYTNHHDRPRVGKTNRDKASGAHARRYTNRQVREDWRNAVRNASDTRAASGVPFPYGTCNGKKNRSRVTGIGGSSVSLIGNGGDSLNLRSKVRRGHLRKCRAQ